MVMHEIHENLPDYHLGQILVDGCPECERRGADVELAISHLDSENFHRAWIRAREWNTGSMGDPEVKRHISHAEAPLLRTLYAVRVKLESTFIDGITALLEGKAP